MNDAPPPRRKYRWPWFVLAGFILAIVLAVVWMRHEIERAKFLGNMNSEAVPAENQNPSNSASPDPQSE